ncbi:MAG: porin family protein [Bdellovibrionaceae bacterium]|nr:porin family protein [Pseudobdellovibrionaceae bacterium]
MRRIFTTSLFALTTLCTTLPAWAADDAETTRLPQLRRPEGILLAQDGDDSYDPFADYSEFEESSEEEEDVNFFRNGRLLTMGFIVGYRDWTGNLGTIYSGDPTFGLYLSYFFDLRFALQFGFLTGSHTLVAVGPSETLNGNVSIADLSFNLKYYFNTQNVTRGLADLNPYIISGFSYLMRTTVIDLAADDVAKDGAFGFNIGAGIEIPMMRNKMYFGLQGAYQMAAFPDENKSIKQSDEVTPVIKPSGDSFTALGILGVNF